MKDCGPVGPFSGHQMPASSHVFADAATCNEGRSTLSRLYSSQTISYGAETSSLRLVAALREGPDESN